MEPIPRKYTRSRFWERPTINLKNSLKCNRVKTKRRPQKWAPQLRHIPPQLLHTFQQTKPNPYFKSTQERQESPRIITPSVRVLLEDRWVIDTPSDEDTSDEAYRKRHSPFEKKEYEAYQLQQTLMKARRAQKPLTKSQKKLNVDVFYVYNTILPDDTPKARKTRPRTKTVEKHLNDRKHYSTPSKEPTPKKFRRSDTSILQKSNQIQFCLSDPILLHIFSFLQSRDVVGIACVSKRFYGASYVEKKRRVFDLKTLFRCFSCAKWFDCTLSRPVQYEDFYYCSFPCAYIKGMLPAMINYFIDLERPIMPYLLQDSEIPELHLEEPEQELEPELQPELQVEPESLRLDPEPFGELEIFGLPSLDLEVFLETDPFGDRELLEREKDPNWWVNSADYTDLEPTLACC